MIMPIVLAFLSAPVLASGFTESSIQETTAPQDLNATDSWLKDSIQKLDFSGFDTSAFSVISTGTDNDIVSMYEAAVKDMADNGWGKIPTDGFSSAEGFKGYKLTMDNGNSTAMDLFQSTFSNVYNAMKDGSFMADLSIYDKGKVVNGEADMENIKKEGNEKLKTVGDMTEMTGMVNEFSKAVNKEMSQFTGDPLFNSAKKGLDFVNTTI